MSGNIFNDVLYPFFQLIVSMSEYVSQFLFETHDIGGFQVSGLGLLTGGMLITILIMTLVKKIFPLL